MKKTTVAIAALAAVLGASAQAKVSSQSEFAGYNACVEASEADHNGLVLSRVYYLSSQGDTNTYYLNGTAWENGERVDVRISCNTSRNGRTLIDQTSSNGRFAIDGGTGSFDVAAK